MSLAIQYIEHLNIYILRAVLDVERTMYKYSTAFRFLILMWWDLAHLMEDFVSEDSVLIMFIPI